MKRDPLRRSLEAECFSIQPKMASALTIKKRTMDLRIQAPTISTSLLAVSTPRPSGCAKSSGAWSCLRLCLVSIWGFFMGVLVTQGWVYLAKAPCYKFVIFSGLFNSARVHFLTLGTHHS